jgi:hypothetical protein
MNNAPGDSQFGNDPFDRQKDAGSPDFFYGCARLSIWVPIICSILCKGVLSATEDVQGDTRRWIALGLGAIFIISMLAGIALAIIALCGISRFGSHGILGRAVSGLVLSFFLLSCFGIGFLHGHQSRVLARTMNESKKGLEAEMTRDLDEGKGLSPENQQARLGGIQQRLEAASQNSSGTDALYAKAASGLLARMQIEMKKYSIAVQPIIDGSVLDMSRVTQREQLQRKREQVKTFLAANQIYLAFVTNGESVLKEELLKLPLSPKARESALNEFHGTSLAQRPIMARIREDDRRCGVAMLEILDLLDDNWDKWHFDEQKGKVIFAEDAILDKYLDHMNEIKAAAQDQTRYQRQLISISTK